MARLTVGQKAERVVRLLLGMRSAHVVAALRPHGFSQEDLDEGWARLKALTDDQFDQLAPPPAQDPRWLEQLDAWENRWFPIAHASLRGRYPEAHAWLFLNLPQTSGPELVLSVGKFVQRLRAMGEDAELGEQGAAARQLLVQRGLDTEAVAEAQRLLERLQSAVAAPELPAPDPEAAAAAEAHMWSWYLEWSEIARVAISNRNLLRQLGFLRYSASRASERVAVDPPAADDAGASGARRTPVFDDAR